MSHFNKVRNFPKHSLSKNCKSYTSFDKQDFVCPTEKRLSQFFIPRKRQFLEEIPTHIINYASPVLLGCPSQWTVSRGRVTADLVILT